MRVRWLRSGLRSLQETATARKQAAFDRLLAIAPALEAAGVAPLTEEQFQVEIKSARAERRARSGGNRADRL